jgi:hypothetical protein
MDDEISEAVAAMADHADHRAKKVDPRAIDYRGAVHELNNLSRLWQEKLDGWEPERFEWTVSQDRIDLFSATEGFGPDGPFVDVSGNIPTGVPSFPFLLGQMLTIHVHRNRAYVSPDSDPLDNYVKAGASIGVPGWKAAFMRMSEKQNRLQNLLMNDIDDPETAEDNLLDIAVLALLTLDLWKKGR